MLLKKQLTITIQNKINSIIPKNQIFQKTNKQLQLYLSSPIYKNRQLKFKIPIIKQKSKNMQPQKSLAIFHNKQNLLHKSSRQHPEHPERILYVLDVIDEIRKSVKGIDVREIKFDGKNEEEHQRIQGIIREMHGEDYWEFVREMWHEGIKKAQMYINMDTYFMKDTYHAARQAVRTTLYAIDHLFSNQSTDHWAFSLVRPPGHHCGMKTQPHGFSFFNNIAIATNYTIQKYKLKKIAIIDWDVHHGEGTQKLFYQKKNPLYISIHRYDNGKFFPHVKQSSSQYIGQKQGKGFNVNICWNLIGVENKKKGEEFRREETCGDQQYAYAFDSLIIPILREYDPQAIFISCGFDSAKGDVIGGVQITPNGFAYMTQKLRNLNKKALLVFEGGYTENSIRSSSQAVIRTAIDQLSPELIKGIQYLNTGTYQLNQIGKLGIQQARGHLKNYWTNI